MLAVSINPPRLAKCILIDVYTSGKRGVLRALHNPIKKGAGLPEEPAPFLCALPSLREVIAS
jgi:hypothetical protein